MKRGFDIFFSFLGLLLLSPLFVLSAIFVKVGSKGPVFFVQKRIGKKFEPFGFYKFRTMVHGSSGLSITAGNDPRVTRAGRLLRRTKIDELPQLWNVLRGDMSLVGPRPEVPEYVELFKDEYSEILKARPGITDYATIEFRNEEEVLKGYENLEEGYIKAVLPAKIELYKKYLKERNFFTDIKLILLTLVKIFR